MGPGAGGRCPAGGHPGPLARTPLLPPLRPLGAGLLFGPLPTVCLLPASPLPRRAALWGEGGASGRRWGWRLGSAVTGQWSAGQWDPLAARVRVPRAAGARPPLVRPWPPPSPRPGVAPVLLLRGQRGGDGGWALRVGGPGPAGGVLRVVSPLTPPRAHCPGSGAWLAGRPAIAVGLGSHPRLRLRGGWGCGGDGFLGR